MIRMRMRLWRMRGGVDARIEESQLGMRKAKIGDEEAAASEWIGERGSGREWMESRSRLEGYC